AVACSSDFVAAAQGAQGLAVIDISNPLNAFTAHDISVNGPARAVAAADGLAYVGTANGIVTVVDLGSGLMVDRIWPGSAVHDLAIGGDTLFVVSESELRSYRIGGHLQPLGRAPLALSAEGLTGRRRSFVGRG